MWFAGMFLIMIIYCNFEELKLIKLIYSNFDNLILIMLNYSNFDDLILGYHPSSLLIARGTC